MQAFARSALDNGVERTGTGYFDWLSTDLLSNIILRTEPLARLICATQVCKAWRLLTKEPTLWRELSIISIDPEEKHAKVLRRFFIDLDDTGLDRFSATIDPTFVRKFYLHTHKVSAACAKRALSRFTALEELDVSGTFNSEGHGPTSGTTCLLLDVLSHAAQQPWISTLKKMHIRGEQTRRGRSDVMRLISAAHSLEAIYLPVELSNATALAEIVAGWQLARGGLSVAPLLTELTLNVDTGGGSLDAIDQIGSLFPDLRVLDWRVSSFIVKPQLVVAPMTSLRELSLDRGYLYSRIHGHKPASTAEMVHTLRKILPACPNLIKFMLSYGDSMRENVFDKDEQHPHPGVGDTLALLPRALKELDLRFINLHEGDLVPSNLPALKEMKLWNCAKAAQIGQAFIEDEQCPGITKKVVMDMSFATILSLF